MLNWETILWASTGFFISGPLGALIGGVLGYLLSQDNSKSGGFDTVKKKESSRKSFYTETSKKQTAFFVSLVALLAKLTQVDGSTSSEEIREIRRFFEEKLNYSGDNLNIVKSLLKESLHTNYSLEEIVLDFKKYSDKFLNLELLNALFKIAFADNVLHLEEEKYIKKIAELLEISPEEFESIKSRFIDITDKYYKILGVSSTATDEEIKKQYRHLITQYHPDKIIAKGLPEDFVEFANERIKVINDAYNKIKKERGL